jgi:hypothetical protein
MRRAVFILFVVAASLLVSPLGAAQTRGGGLLVIRVCGSNGCKAIFNGLSLVDPSGPPAEPVSAPPIGPFYVLEPSNYKSPEQTEGTLGPTTPAFFVPDPGVLRARPDPGQFAPQEWLRLSDIRKTGLLSSLRGLEPFPGPRLQDVLIRGRAASDPESYHSLYESFPVVQEPDPATRGKPVAIALRSDELSPWTDGHNRIAYYPDVRLLFRDGQWVRPSPELVERIEHPALPAGGVPWDRIAGMAGPLIVLAGIALLWLLGRRRATKLEATARLQ